MSSRSSEGDRKRDPNETRGTGQSLKDLNLGSLERSGRMQNLRLLQEGAGVERVSDSSDRNPSPKIMGIHRKVSMLTLERQEATRLSVKKLGEVSEGTLLKRDF